MNVNSILKAINAIKNTPRTGWILRGVPAPIAESIAEHMYEAAFLSIILYSELAKRGVKIDLGETVLITILHDVPEAYTGDIIKAIKDKIPYTEEIELSFVEEKIKVPIIVNLIKEYIEKRSVEAVLAKLAETLSTYVQAKRYVKMGYHNVKEIMDNTEKEIEKMLNIPPISKISDFVKKEFLM
ncbi:MAG: phosphohydrolase [Thermoprotei archaeon]|nr:MAG: phosphohydrolase [Thermoprotei archaeon]